MVHTTVRDACCSRGYSVLVRKIAAHFSEIGTKFVAEKSKKKQTPMRHIILLTLLMMASMMAVAQTEEFRPCRTPEEEALKQTEMLSRELQLTEQQRDTVYRIHLKYARMRQISNTRAEGLQRMNTMTQELLAVMTEEQRERFLNKQIGPHPQRAMQPRIARPITADSVK